MAMIVFIANIQLMTRSTNDECRTGPFEGFFVSSVEFCKHVKFDDRKDNKDRDNRTGTQGPPGPPGPQGPPGQNATQVIVNNIRDVITNQTLQCVLNTSVDPASIDCILPPPVLLANLNVTKNVQCRSTNGSPDNDAVCAYVLPNISPADYNMTVTGNNPIPSQFPGSSSGTIVLLGAGDYVVDEEFADLSQLQDDLNALSIIQTANVDAGSDCTGNFGPIREFLNANGTISAGESQLCAITNTITVVGGTVPPSG
jgi:hypothetical protein